MNKYIDIYLKLTLFVALLLTLYVPILLGTYLGKPWMLTALIVVPFNLTIMSYLLSEPTKIGHLRK